MKNYQKYSPMYFPPPEGEIEWVKKDHIETPPVWCSVDLRDGNQALVVPMPLETKLEMFTFLCNLGFKEIEVGFPAASETEYSFLKTLIEEDLVPDDVTLQVLTQARPHIIKETFKSLRGCKNAIVHLYNSTSKAQREQVFRKSREEIIKIAADGAYMLKDFASESDIENIRFEYSPESFTGTEMDFALEISNSVIDIFRPEKDRKMILNLPATVEVSMPHVYANQIEYISRNINRRDAVVLSIHPHNDRGTGIAAAEMALLAGGERIEGTLFGNGERTGNVDIVTLAMNMFSQGVDPELDFSNMPEVVKGYETYTGLKVGPRHPYSGKLVFAAFSGSHQDAIAKGMKWRKEKDTDKWLVPYLPIDPGDVGRKYDKDVIRINSQSGKGGVSYVLEQNYGFFIPEAMKMEVGYMMKGISDKSHAELGSEDIFNAFMEEYVNIGSPLQIDEAHFIQIPGSDTEEKVIKVEMKASIYGNNMALEGTGRGRLDAVSDALEKSGCDFDYEFITYSEHAISRGTTSKAASYVTIADQKGKRYYGVGIDDDIILSSVKALVSAVNRKQKDTEEV